MSMFLAHRLEYQIFNLFCLYDDATYHSTLTDSESDLKGLETVQINRAELSCLDLIINT